MLKEVSRAYYFCSNESVGCYTKKERNKNQLLISYDLCEFIFIKRFFITSKLNGKIIRNFTFLFLNLILSSILCTRKFKLS